MKYNISNTLFFNTVHRHKIVQQLLLIPILLCAATSVAQDKDPEDLGTEVVNIVKPYTPTISDAFKVRETPILNDSISTPKKKVSYEIFSVPVASTFTPAKGKATSVEKAKPLRLYDNYATLGFGNYTTTLGELFSNFKISRTDNAGFFFRHNSSQGGIDDILLENKYYDTQLNGHYRSHQKEMSYGINAGVSHQIFHWYGLNEFAETFTAEELAAIDPKQSYFDAYLKGDIALESSFFKEAQAELRFLSDGFSSSEINVTAHPSFLFPLSEFNLKIDGALDYLTGRFDRDYNNSGTTIDYGYLNLGITPALVYVNNDLTLSLGAAIVLGMNTEQSNSDVFIYPQIQVSYRLIDEELIAYGGALGGLHQNTYHQFKSDNPFVSPTLFIAPTNQKYNAFGGIRGKISNTVGYNVSANFSNEENRAFFQINSYKGRIPNIEGYEYGNSFAVVYDDLTTLDIAGELKVDVSEKFTLGASANFYSYSTDLIEEAWNLPDIAATLFSHVTISEKWHGGVSLFYVGARKDFFTVTQLGIPTGPIAEIQTLKSYFDANINIGYQVNDRLSIFAKGSNLLGNNYEKWLNFPVQGIQGLLGATYKFDWQ